MKSNFVNRAITAMNNAGFEVIGFKRKDYGPLKLKVIPNSVETGEPGCEKREVITIARTAGRDPGETCNLARFLRAQDWRHALSLTQEVIRAGSTAALNVGDFIRVKFDVPAASYDGVEFPALHVDGKVQIIEKEDDKIIFNFDDIIFQSAVNAKDTNAGGFFASALAKYLNHEFLDAMGITDVLLANNDGLEISLLTAFELFGDREYWEAESNYFEETRQIEYFKNEKNRVKSFDDETDWYWTSSVRASSSSYFCYVNNIGLSSSHFASAVGGVVPAFCVA
jgi:hypothetical protein